jgi:predicted flavoprotein YhiN
VEWLELHGVQVKCERDLRIFPVSDNSSEVIGAFEKVFLQHNNKITVHTSTTVKALEQTSSTYFIQYDTGQIHADMVVITTG